MSSARKIIEGVDDPEGFNLKGHLDSPLARLAITNGFERNDRSDTEERYVKKLTDGREAWLRTNARSPYDSPEVLDPMDPQRSGGRQWEFVLVTPTVKCRHCHQERAKRGVCPHCNRDEGVLAYNEYHQMMRGSEMTLNYVLGAMLQRLATWPAHVPRPAPLGKRPRQRGFKQKLDLGGKDKV